MASTLSRMRLKRVSQSSRIVTGSPAEGSGALPSRRVGEIARAVFGAAPVGGALGAGDAELLARIDRPGGFKNVDSHQQVGFTVGDGAGGRSSAECRVRAYASAEC